jgi:glycosyltransferase 2 family protein
MRKMIPFLKFSLPLLAGLMLLFYAFKNVQLDDFLYKLNLTRYGWVIGSMLLSLVAYASRAYRWQLLLRAADQKVSTFRLTLAVFVGYLANLAFPRLGEVVRCVVLKKTNQIPVSLSIGTVVTERIIDSLVLFFFLTIALLLEFDLIVTYFENILSTHHIPLDGILHAALTLLMIFSILFFVILRTNKSWSQRIKKMALEVLKGILTIKSIQSKSLFLTTTTVMWFTYFLMSYMIFFALEETSSLSLTAGFMLLVSGGIALALPVQGGIGTYHAMIAMMLGLYCIENTTGLFLATLLHSSQILSVVIFGGISLVITLSIEKNNRNDLK